MECEEGVTHESAASSHQLQKRRKRVLGVSCISPTHVDRVSRQGVAVIGIGICRHRVKVKVKCSGDLRTPAYQ